MQRLTAERIRGGSPRYFVSGPLKCPECGALFYSREDFEAHVSAWHRPGGQYYLVCPKCGKRFKDRRSLEAHLREHPEEAEERIKPLTEYGEG